ncbi:hypothetical protein V1512DRAFT_265885 [Lipomyces arxii]|uniref:uncharacterized protein n=1 Tax=Lipomyces arxii TaxID=56418 RepID=UPI0034CEADED
MPFYCRAVYYKSPTYVKWVPMLIADIHKLRRLELCALSAAFNDYYWLNHPVRQVCIAGMAMDVRDNEYVSIVVGTYFKARVRSLLTYASG